MGHWSTQNLRAFYTFAPAGKVRDHTGYGNNGTLTGTNWIGSGLNLNGSSDFVFFDGRYLLPEAANEFTFISIVRPNTPSTGATEVMFSNGDVSTDGFYVRWNSGDWYFRINADGGLAVPGVTGAYQHVAMTKKGTVGTIYVNNAPTVDAVPATMTTPSIPTHMGVRDTTNTLFFEGDVALLAIYDRALSASEVRQLYVNPYLPIRSVHDISLGSVIAPPSGIIPLIMYNRRLAS